jgi:hypothetical protein
MILAELIQNADVILALLTPSHLRRYDSLQRSLHTSDVSADREYQRVFNGFYRMQRRPRGWYVFFFSLLEREKNNAALTFPDVLQRIYAEMRSVEPSFCSKLVATVRPELPVYDKHVRDNLSLAVPGPHESPESRVQKFVVAYADLEATVGRLAERDEFSILRQSFDEAFPEYAHFTDTKKLDLLLWQNRPSTAG